MFSIAGHLVFHLISWLTPTSFPGSSSFWCSLVDFGCLLRTGKEEAQAGLWPDLFVLYRWCKWAKILVFLLGLFPPSTDPFITLLFYPGAWDTLGASFSCYLVLAGSGLSRKLRSCIPLLDLVSIAKHQARLLVLLVNLSPRGWMLWGMLLDKKCGEEVRDLPIYSRTSRNNVGGTSFIPDFSSSAVSENTENTQRLSAVEGENHKWFYTSVFSF